ncbi:hypothetical protein V1517DRAFT_314124 [Lipomyces orientalis]|uniref:Uncharacterized protein n=1 Tax=Lipomyces orientalis TaxID=1233043 RepID=A0ACC3TW61_9ASCO
MNHTDGAFIAAAEITDHDSLLAAMNRPGTTDPQDMTKSPEAVRKDITDTITIIVLLLEIIYYIYQIYRGRKRGRGSKSTGDRSHELANNARALGVLLSTYEIPSTIATKSELVSILNERPVFKDFYRVSDSGFAKLASRYPDAMQVAIDYARAGDYSETPNLAAVVSMLNDMISLSGICPYIRALKEGSLDPIWRSPNISMTISTSREILRQLKAIESSEIHLEEGINERSRADESFLAVASNVASKLDTC